MNGRPLGTKSAPHGHGFRPPAITITGRNSRPHTAKQTAVRHDMSRTPVEQANPKGTTQT